MVVPVGAIAEVPTSLEGALVVVESLHRPRVAHLVSFWQRGGFPRTYCGVTLTLWRPTDDAGQVLCGRCRASWRRRPW